MVKNIIKVLADRKIKQAHQRRLANNHKQLIAIYKGLEERGH